MGNEYISLFGIIFSLALLIFTAFKGIPIMIGAPLCAMLVAIISAANPYEAMVGPFMEKWLNFANSNALMFTLSAIFGKVMGECGASKVIAYKCATIAKKVPGQEKYLAVCSLVLINTVLTLGGISTFVVVFTLVSIAKDLFEELDVPWHLYMCSSLGSGTYTMSMIPGSPAIQNIIPTEYLGTTPTAAPVLGICCTILALILGLSYIKYAVNKTQKKGEGFLPTGAEISKVQLPVDEVPNLNFILCLLPPVFLIVLLNAFGLPAIVCLFFSIILTCVLFWKTLKTPVKQLKAGADNGLLTLCNTCMIVGFGGVVASVPGYQLVMGGLDSIPGPPVVQLIVAINVAAGLSGSASGGLGLGLDFFAQKFIDMGMNPQIIHRVACISSGGLDSLPHNSAVVNNLGVTRLTHGQAYKHQGMLTVVLPLIVCVFAAVLSELGVC